MLQHLNWFNAVILKTAEQKITANMILRWISVTLLKWVQSQKNNKQVQLFGV